MPANPDDWYEELTQRLQDTFSGAEGHFLRADRNARDTARRMHEATHRIQEDFAEMQRRFEADRQRAMESGVPVVTATQHAAQPAAVTFTVTEANKEPLLKRILNAIRRGRDARGVRAEEEI